MIRIDVNIDDDQLVEGLAALARQEKLLTGWQLHSLPCGADPT